MKRILVAKEKHGTWYYDASDDEQLAKSALKILTDRAKEGYWYHDPEEIFDEDSKYSTYMKQLIPEYDRSAPIEERKALVQKYIDWKVNPFKESDPDIYESRRKKVEMAARNEKEYVQYKNWFDEMKELVESQDWTQMVTFKSGRQTPLAWHLLEQRGDYEYENVTLEDLQENEVKVNA